MASGPATARLCLWGVLAFALAIRVAVIVAGPYIIHPDELFQYYEQAHRLAFGSGVVPWEFHDGARSWLLPGMLAAIMKLSRWVGSDPIYYIDAIRIGCAVLSLTVVYVGFELARRRDGRLGAVITGTLCAIWIDPIFFAPSVMAEVLSAYCILGAILLADTAAGRETPRQMALIGVLLGVAVCLRVQMGPASLVFAVLFCRSKWRRCWLPLLAGGGGVVVLDLGLLDFLTWGSPFHSVWHYVLRGVFEGFGGGFANQTGGGSIYAYARLIGGAWTPLGLPLAALAVIGALRVPLLAIVLLAVVETHLAFANAEYRYLCCALLALPILMGLGAIFLCNAATQRFSFLHQRGRGIIKIAAGAAVLAYAAVASYVAGSSGILFRHLDRGTLEAFLTAHRQPQLCGLGVLGVSWLHGGAYTFFDRDAPLYSGNFYKVVTISDPGIAIPQSIVLRGRPLPLYRDKELTHDAALYNYLIAPPDNGVAGFAPVECFSNGAGSAHPKICLFRRPGGCEIPFVAPQVDTE